MTDDDPLEFKVVRVGETACFRLLCSCGTQGAIRAFDVHPASGGER
jgi:hypothetical protein